MPGGFVYELTSEDKRERFASGEGYFPHLGENQYILTGKVGNCQKQIGDKITLPEEDCKDVYITADGDGIDDFYYFTTQGKVSISDKFGNVVTELNTPTRWEATGRGQKVAPGLYFANINDGEKMIRITVVY
jgi:hypothetical protein